jgi:hypothetical protein
VGRCSTDRNGGAFEVSDAVLEHRVARPVRDREVDADRRNPEPPHETGLVGAEDGVVVAVLLRLISERETLVREQVRAAAGDLRVVVTGLVEPLLQGGGTEVGDIVGQIVDALRLLVLAEPGDRRRKEQDPGTQDRDERDRQ